MRRDLLTSVIRSTIPRPVRNWLRSPSKTAGWLLDATAYTLGVTKELRINERLTLICHPRAYRVAYQAQVTDPEEREEFSNFLAHCSETMLLFDLGAHFGIFSLAAAYCGGRAVAVDPSPIATRMLKRQANINGLTERIRIIQAAVSDSRSRVNMLTSGVFSNGYFRSVQGRPENDLTTTSATTLDQMSAEVGRPTHIKIDVEGQEAAVLCGGRKTLERYSPVLFLELHNELIRQDGGDPNSALNELARSGYSVRGLNGRAMNRDEILGKALVRVVALKPCCE